MDDEEDKYLDPKIMRPVEGQPKSRQPISQAILFMIGGGSYIEYQVNYFKIIKIILNIIF